MAKASYGGMMSQLTQIHSNDLIAVCNAKTHSDI
jgi:hypothetical protein